MPGFPSARLLDTAGHGGSIAFGEVTVMIDGQPAARVGDPILCPGATGTVLHVGGNIVQGSISVVIGGAFGARMGDPTACMSVGIVGIGMPHVRGTPGSFERDVEPGEYFSWAQESGYNNDQGSQLIENRSYEHSEDEGTNVFGQRVVETTDFGNLRTEDTDGDGGGGGGIQASAYRRQTTIYNHDGSIETVTTISGGNLQSDSHYLMGDDGRRIGVGFDACGQVSAGDVTEVETTRIPLPFGYDIQIDSTVGASAAAMGGGGQVGVFYDRQDERQHSVALIDIEAIFGGKLGLDVSFGESPQVNTGKGVVATPGVITSGSSTVNIG